MYIINIYAARKPGFQCDNPFFSREPDELLQREYDWCVEKRFHVPRGKSRAMDKSYPVKQRSKRIELAFKERSFVDFNFLVACETKNTDGEILSCGRNLMMTGKAPECNQLVTDKDDDGVCDKLDECMWDPKNEKDPITGLCVINPSTTTTKATTQVPTVATCGGISATIVIVSVLTHLLHTHKFFDMNTYYFVQHNIHFATCFTNDTLFVCRCGNGFCSHVDPQKARWHCVGHWFE